MNGGAIALGHPLGCSGARLLTTLVWELRRRGAKRGLATMCVGVGQGVATIVENPRREPRPAMIDFELTDEQRLIRETAAEFADREIIPRARDNDRDAALRPRLGGQARRDGLPRRDRARGVRRPRRRLPHLRR